MKTFFLLLFIMGSLQALAFDGVDEPKSCWQLKIQPCAVRASNRGLNLVTEFGLLKLLPRTSVLFSHSHKFELLEGSVLAEETKEHQFKFAKLEFTVSGDVWLERRRDRSLIIRNFFGVVRESPKKEIPAGFENWYLGHSHANHVNQGLLKPIVWAEVVGPWSKVAGSREKMKAKIVNYRSQWRQAVAESSQLYRDIVGRQLASVEDKKKREIQARQRAKEEAAFLKQLFRERNSL